MSLISLTPILFPSLLSVSVLLSFLGFLVILLGCVLTF